MTWASETGDPTEETQAGEWWSWEDSRAQK